MNSVSYENFLQNKLHHVCSFSDVKKFVILCNGVSVTLSEEQKKAILSMTPRNVLIFGKSDFPSVPNASIHPCHFAICKTGDCYNLYGMSEGLYETSVRIL